MKSLRLEFHDIATDKAKKKSFKTKLIQIDNILIFMTNIKAMYVWEIRTSK